MIMKVCKDILIIKVEKPSELIDCYSVIKYKYSL